MIEEKIIKIFFLVSKSFHESENENQPATGSFPIELSSDERERNKESVTMRLGKEMTWV